MMSKKWTITEQARFLKLIGELLERGYPLSEAIESLKFQHWKQKGDLFRCLQYLKEGYTFSEILSQLHFKEYLVGYVFFAEQHGGMTEALKEGSEIATKRQHDLDKLIKLLTYPILLFLITVMLFVVIDTILIPRFTQLFHTLQIETNLFSKLITTIGNALPLSFFIGFGLSIALLVYYFYYFRKYEPEKQKKLLVKLPLIGPFLRLMYTHFFASQLSHLLSGGISINEACQLFEKNHDQPFYQQIGIAIKTKLVMGEQLTDILANLTYFEADMVHIVAHGQKNGRLDKELFFYSRHCLQLAENKMERWLKLIQPVLYSIIGLLIVSMYLAILLPMFKLLEGF